MDCCRNLAALCGMWMRLALCGCQRGGGPIGWAPQTDAPGRPSVGGPLSPPVPRMRLTPSSPHPCSVLAASFVLCGPILPVGWKFPRKDAATVPSTGSEPVRNRAKERARQRPARGRPQNLPALPLRWEKIAVFRSEEDRFWHGGQKWFQVSKKSGLMDKSTKRPIFFRLPAAQRLRDSQ